MDAMAPATYIFLFLIVSPKILRDPAHILPHLNSRFLHVGDTRQERLPSPQLDDPLSVPPQRAAGSIQSLPIKRWKIRFHQASTWVCWSMTGSTRAWPGIVFIPLRGRSLCFYQKLLWRVSLQCLWHIISFSGNLALGVIGSQIFMESSSRRHNSHK